MNQYLTQDEVDTLPPGALVRIVWGGGGEAEYVVGKHGKSSYTTFLMSDGVTRKLNAHINFVGQEKPFHRVTLVSMPEAI